LTGIDVWWPNVKCGLQTSGLTDPTGNENCFDPSRHRTYNQGYGYLLTGSKI